MFHSEIKISLICFHSLYHSLSFVFSRCHSLLVFFIGCHSLYHSLSLVVLIVVTRCHSLYHSMSFVVTPCHSLYHSLSLDVQLVCLFINDLQNCKFSRYLQISFFFFFENGHQDQKQPPHVFYKKGVLKNFAIFTRKHLCSSFFLTKLQAFRPSEIHINTWKTLKTVFTIIA